MDQITSILVALGLDPTFYVQTLIFVVAYIALTQLIFKPYLNAFHERKKRTVGNEESAERVISESQQLEHEYEKKAKQINSDFKVIFDRSRSEALKEYDGIVAAARSQAKEIIDKARAEIVKEVEAAQSEIDKEAPGVAKSIATKVMGKDIGA